MLEGRLGDFTLPDILRLLAFTRKSGQLTVREDGGPREGRLVVDGGRVLDVSSDTSTVPLARRLLGQGLADADVLRGLLRGRDQLPMDAELAAAVVASGVDDTAVDALLRDQVLDEAADLLGWDAGTFRFAAAAAPVGISHAGSDVDVLLAEVDARRVAAADTDARLGAGARRVVIVRPAQDAVTVGAAGWALLALVDGRRSVDEIVRLAGTGRFETRRTLAELVELQVVTLAEGMEATGDALLRAHAVLAGLEADLGGATVEGAPSTLPPPVPAAAALVPDGDVVLAADLDAASGWSDADAPVAGAVDAEAPVAEVPADHGEGFFAPPADTSEPDAGTPHLAPPGADDVAEALDARLAIDPSVDEELVGRLIAGVRGMP